MFLNKMFPYAEFMFPEQFYFLLPFNVKKKFFDYDATVKPNKLKFFLLKT